MSNWKEYKKLFRPKNFDWSITESIIGRGNSISEIIYGFGENCIDFICKPEDIDIAYTYIYEILEFYQKKFSKNDRKEIKNVIIFFLLNLNDLILDNYFSIDILGGLVYLLNEYKIFTLKEIDELEDLEYDQLKSVFGVVSKSINFYSHGRKNQEIKLLLQIPIFKSNKSLFSIISDIKG